MSGPEFVRWSTGLVLLAAALAPVSRSLWREHRASAGADPCAVERARLLGEAASGFRVGLYFWLVCVMAAVCGTLERGVGTEAYGPGMTTAIHASGWFLYAAAAGSFWLGGKALSAAVAVLRRRAALTGPRDAADIR